MRAAAAAAVGDGVCRSSKSQRNPLSKFDSFGRGIDHCLAFVWNVLGPGRFRTCLHTCYLSGCSHILGQISKLHTICLPMTFGGMHFRQYHEHFFDLRPWGFLLDFGFAWDSCHDCGNCTWSISCPCAHPVPLDDLAISLSQTAASGQDLRVVGVFFDPPVSPGVCSVPRSPKA